MEHKHTTRNPAGVTKSKQIALRLMPDESADAACIAANIGCSKSSLARKAFLIGLAQLKARLGHAGVTAASRSAA